jgi:hypothetical protein
MDVDPGTSSKGADTARMPALGYVPPRETACPKCVYQEVPVGGSIVVSNNQPI